VEDGAPAHRSALAKAARSELGIVPFPHTANSPQISPIENVWQMLKSRIAKIPGAHGSMDKLWEAAQKVWSELTEEDIRKYTSSMPQRVHDLIAASGGHIDY
ncbi:hypothetical protein PENSPDRAFT_547126, partial [Peniophora sp. CONT]